MLHPLQWNICIFIAQSESVRKRPASPIFESTDLVKLSQSDDKGFAQEFCIIYYIKIIGKRKDFP